MVATLRKVPSSSSTVGPSMSMHGVTAQALPGLSTFIWVPTDRNPPRASIETGFTPAAASPEARLLPYRSLNPPGSPGSPKTGLPAIMSSMKRLTLGISLLLTPSSLSAPALSLPTNWATKSQPGTSSLCVCLSIFGALRHSPSPMTSKTPPRILVRADPFELTMLRTSL